MDYIMLRVCNLFCSFSCIVVVWSSGPVPQRRNGLHHASCLQFVLLIQLYRRRVVQWSCTPKKKWITSCFVFAICFAHSVVSSSCGPVVLYPKEEMDYIMLRVCNLFCSFSCIVVVWSSGPVPQRRNGLHHASCLQFVLLIQLYR